MVCVRKLGFMTEKSDENGNNLTEIRLARDQAEMLRDQLAAEYEQLQKEGDNVELIWADKEKFDRGCEAMRKAIAAADLALSSIDQALRDMERVRDDHDQQES